MRITTVPISLKLLITGQMKFMQLQGFQVTMVSGAGKEIREVIENENCPHHLIPFTRTISPIQDLKCLWQLARLVKREKPDIVHTHTPKAGLLGMLAAKICGVPVKLHTVAGLPLMTTSGSRRKLLENMEKLTYWAADYVLPNSRSLKDFILEHKFLPANKVHIISKGSSNGIDLDRFTKSKVPSHELDVLKTDLRYQADATYLISIGRIVRDKGIIELVRVFLSLKPEFPKLKLLLVGPIETERPEEALPTSILEAIENDPAIVHIPWSDQVEHLLAMADILVHASYREGFPNVALQAGAMECPIVCSNIPGNTDIVTDGKTGLTFKVGDEVDLKAKLEFALHNPAVIKKYSNLLLAEIRENYDRQVIHEGLLSFYMQCLQIKQVATSVTD